MSVKPLAKKGLPKTELRDMQLFGPTFKTIWKHLFVKSHVWSDPVWAFESGGALLYSMAVNHLQGGSEPK